MLQITRKQKMNGQLMKRNLIELDQIIEKKEKASNLN